MRKPNFSNSFDFFRCILVLTLSIFVLTYLWRSVEKYRVRIFLFGKLRQDSTFWIFFIFSLLSGRSGGDFLAGGADDGIRLPRRHSLQSGKYIFFLPFVTKMGERVKTPFYPSCPCP